ncbi:hypothetical protein [Lentzea californiensis]|uniref:hypothetical protein n=1 Tax=Lentzea californiensis TaxID=438851 RepID=UPI002164BCAC|nr:hypothetical protein [Lentzea californiensis]
MVTALVLVVSAGAAVHGGLSVDGGGSGIVFVGFAVMLLHLLVFLPKGTGLALDDERYLTGRTVSGRRTVDLDRLVRVRRIRVPARSIDLHWVELVDAGGVRLFVNDESAPREVERVLANHTAGLPYMSRGKAFLFSLGSLAVPVAVAALVHLVT